MTTDTPRVDAICKTRNCGYWGIPYEFACQLEREVGLLEHDIAIQNKQLSDCWVKIKSLEMELEQAAYDKADLVREIEKLQMYRKAAEKDAERYQKLRRWHPRIEVRYWTGEYWEPLIDDKLDAVLDHSCDSGIMPCRVRGL